MRGKYYGKQALRGTVRLVAHALLPVTARRTGDDILRPLHERGLWHNPPSALLLDRALSLPVFAL